MDIVKQLVAKHHPDCFKEYSEDGSIPGIEQGDIVGTKYLYRTHHNHLGNIWLMDSHINSSEKGADLLGWVEEKWDHQNGFKDYFLVNGIQTKGLLINMLDLSEIFYRVSKDERIKPEFYGMEFSAVLKSYMELIANDTLPVKKSLKHSDAKHQFQYAVLDAERIINTQTQKRPSSGGFFSRIKAQIFSKTNPIKKEKKVFKQEMKSKIAYNPLLKSALSEKNHSAH